MSYLYCDTIYPIGLLHFLTHCLILLLYLLSYFTVLCHWFLAPVFPQGGYQAGSYLRSTDGGCCPPKTAPTWWASERCTLVWRILSTQVSLMYDICDIYVTSLTSPSVTAPKGWMCILTVFLVLCAYMWGWKDQAVYFDFTLWREICVTQL